MSSLSIVVIDSDLDSLGNIVKYIDRSSIVGTASSFESGYELIHKKRPMIVIMEVKVEELDLYIERIEMILTRFPNVSIFAVCTDRSAETILKVMRAGVVEYLLKPVHENDLASALQKIGRLMVKQSFHSQPGAELGHIFTFYSPKGGVGLTTLATNFAVNLHAMTDKSTILVDLDLIAGDVTTFLNMDPEYSLSDVTLNATRLDASFMKGVISHHESGIFVLSEPKNIADGVALSSNDLVKVLALLKTMFTYIIIDTETGLNSKTMMALKMADTLVFAFVLTLPGIKHAQRYLNYFKSMDLDHKIMPVVNRHVKKGDIKLEEASEIVKYPISWDFPNDHESAMTSLNKGGPLMKMAPHSHLNDSINGFAKLLLARKGG